MYKNILNKILLSDKPSNCIYKLIETGEIKEIVPELLELKGFDQQTPYHDKDVLDHTMAVLDAIKPELHLRMAALLHDISKPASFTVVKGRGHFYGHHTKSAEESEKILRRLGYDEEFIYEVKILIRYHYIKEIVSNVKENGIKKFVDSVGEERLDDMLELINADMMGKPNCDNNNEIVQKLRDLSDEYLNNKDTE